MALLYYSQFTIFPFIYFFNPPRGGGGGGPPVFRDGPALLFPILHVSLSLFLSSPTLLPQAAFSFKGQLNGDEIDLAQTFGRGVFFLLFFFFPPSSPPPRFVLNLS